MDNKSKILNWFLEFAYYDIGKLTETEWMKLMMETTLIITTGSFEKGPGAWWFSESTSKVLNDLQAWFIGKFENILEKITQVPTFKEPKWTNKSFSEGFQIIDFSRTPFSHLSKVDILSQTFKYEMESYVNIPLKYRTKEGKEEATWQDGWKDRATIQVAINPLGTQRDILLLRFLDALNGLPIRALKQCLECDRWFLHLSEREKIYCTNKCAARKANRDKRARKKEEDPE